jgi:hypothetical protein
LPEEINLASNLDLIQVNLSKLFQMGLAIILFSKAVLVVTHARNQELSAHATSSTVEMLLAIQVRLEQHLLSQLCLVYHY